MGLVTMLVAILFDEKSKDSDYFHKREGAGGPSEESHAVDF